jgi:membrane-associated protein
MDIVNFFNHFGIFGLSGVLAIEAGFLPLFFLPGDTLLFTAGYLIHNGDLSIHHAFIVLGFGAFVGNMLGYLTGYYAEKPLMKLAKGEGNAFDKGLEKTRKFYKKYGLLTLVFARFLPSVRTIAPFLAGVTKMPFYKFTLVSFFSGLFWVAVGLMLGNFFGKHIPNLEHVMVTVVFVAVMSAALPVLGAIIKSLWNKSKKRNAK